MLERFRQRYPLGSLSSELLTIDHGKYLVRASVQVDGILLATGMGGGDTIEQAEDRARLRAIAVLVLDGEVAAVSKPTNSGLAEMPQPSVIELSAPISVTEPVIEEAIAAVESPSLPAPISVTEPVIEEAIAAVESPSLPAPISVTEPVIEEAIAEPVPAEIPPKSATASKKQEETPLLAEIPLPIEEPLPLMPAKTETEPLLGEPIDFSEVIAKSDMELKRLGWTNEQGRNYLLTTYGKRSRQLLSDEELIEFMQYLQSLPNP